jgi:hypothetical protein
MNANAVARHYGQLTDEERFRLIFAAGARGDEPEQQRIRNAGGLITLAMPDHAPFAHAFEEVSWYTFVFLLEDAARYADLVRLHHTDELPDEDADARPDGGDADAAAAEAEGRVSEIERIKDLMLYRGFQLKTQAAGWKLFCERLNVPPFAVWEKLPGFNRLQGALGVAEMLAFVPEGVVCWLNRIRPAGWAKVQECHITADWYADQHEAFFREQVKWWGG